MQLKSLNVALLMLIQATQGMPNSYKSIPQFATQPHLETSTPFAPAFQFPSISPEDPMYQQIKDVYESIKQWLNIPDYPASQPSKPHTESSSPVPISKPTKPQKPALKPTEEPQKEKPQPPKEASGNEKQPGATENFNPQVVLDLTNELRAQNGKKPLKLHPFLTKEAYKQSKYMESIDDLTHDRPAGAEWGEGYSKAGLSGMIAENVSYGRLTEKEAVTGWSNSPGHRENMLGDFDYMGAAISGQFSTQEFA
jgi:uncharacterized protein YkwD